MWASQLIFLLLMFFSSNRVQCFCASHLLHYANVTDASAVLWTVLTEDLTLCPTWYICVTSLGPLSSGADRRSTEVLYIGFFSNYISGERFWNTFLLNMSIVWGHVKRGNNYYVTPEHGTSVDTSLWWSTWVCRVVTASLLTKRIVNFLTAYKDSLTLQ